MQQEARDYSFVSINVEKALGILVAIAPGRGGLCSSVQSAALTLAS